MATNFSPPSSASVQIGDAGQGSSSQTHVMNSSTQALMVKLEAMPYATTITDFLFFQRTFSGTQANIQYTVRVCTLSSISTILSTVATTTVTPNVGNDKWIKATFSSPPTLTQNTAYGIVITNTSTDPTVDYGSLQYAGGSNSNFGAFYSFYSSTNGFSSNGTWRESRGPFVLKMGNGKYLGNPYTKSAVTTSGTYERGMLIPSQDASFDMLGLTANPNVTSNTGLSVKLYRGSALPGGTVVSEATDSGTSTQFLQGQIQAGSQHRVVFDYSSSTDRPSALEIEDYASYSDLAECRPFGGACYTYESGGAWVEDQAKWPCMSLILGSLPAASGGSVIVIDDD